MLRRRNVQFYNQISISQESFDEVCGVWSNISMTTFEVVSNKCSDCTFTRLNDGRQGIENSGHDELDRTSSDGLINN